MLLESLIEVLAEAHVLKHSLQLRCVLKPTGLLGRRRRRRRGRGRGRGEGGKGRGEEEGIGSMIVLLQSTLAITKGRPFFRMSLLTNLQFRYHPSLSIIRR